MATSMLIRVAPLMAPVMHPVRIRVHNWYVPLRIIWDDFEQFITGGEDGLDSTSWPRITFSSCAEGTLADYLDLPYSTGYTTSTGCSALPFRAYGKIYNDFYRDSQIISELTIDTSSGSDSSTSTALQAVSWPKDYYTTCRPDTQLGNEITIGLSGEAPITGLGSTSQTFPAGTTVYETDGTAGVSYSNAVGGTTINIEQDASNTGFPNVRADLASATGVKITDLRESLALQAYMERMNMHGARYPEYLRSLGIRSPARLQEATYLGGGKNMVQFSEVLSTDDDDTSNYAGKLRGHGISATRTRRWRKFFDEHGIVMSLLSVVPKAIYAKGLHKKFRRSSKEMYWQKELQFIGDDAVANRELDMEHTTPSGTFGYAHKFDDYRQIESGIAGEFNTTLNHYHYARIYGSDPALNPSFINCSPTTRVYQSSGTDQLYIMANHSIQARRLVTRSRRYRIM